MNLKGRNFLTLKDYSPEEIVYLLDLAANLKAKKKAGIPMDCHRGKNIALIFEKTSTRTRCSFEVAAHDLGIGTTYLDPKALRSERKRVLRIRPECWEVCSKESSTVALARKSWKNWRNMRECRCGMG